MHPILRMIIIILLVVAISPLAMAFGIYFIMFYLFYKITIGKFNEWRKFRKYKKIARRTDYDYKKSTAITLKDFVAFDFETTGLDPKESDIIQIGAVKFRDGFIEDEFNTYVKPIMSKITSTTKNINGIWEADVKNAPTIVEIVPDFIDFIGDDYIMAHNAEFDAKFLMTAIDIHNKKTKNNIILENRIFDTLKRSQNMIHDSKNHRLKTLKKYFNINSLDDHDALDDAKACGKLYLNLQKLYYSEK
jgi:DNA polymerase III epsilon subunit family exonuclease